MADHDGVEAEGGIPTLREAFANAMAALGEAAGALSAVGDLLTQHDDERVRRLGRQVAWAGVTASSIGGAVDTAADGLPEEVWNEPIEEKGIEAAGAAEEVPWNEWDEE